MEEKHREVLKIIREQEHAFLEKIYKKSYMTKAGSLVLPIWLSKAIYRELVLLTILPEDKHYPEIQKALEKETKSKTRKFIEAFLVFGLYPSFLLFLLFTGKIVW